MTTEDRIYLRGLKCQCIIGFIDWERQVPQTVVVDLEFPCDCARAAASDSVADTVDYKQVAKRVLAFVERLEIPAHRDPGASPGAAAAQRVLTRVDQDRPQQTRRDSSFARCRCQPRAAPRRPGRRRLARSRPAMARVYVAIGGNVDPERWFPVAARSCDAAFPACGFPPAIEIRPTGLRAPTSSTPSRVLTPRARRSWWWPTVTRSRRRADGGAMIPSGRRASWTSTCCCTAIPSPRPPRTGCRDPTCCVAATCSGRSRKSRPSCDTRPPGARSPITGRSWRASRTRSRELRSTLNA